MTSDHDNVPLSTRYNFRVAGFSLILFYRRDGKIKQKDTVETSCKEKFIVNNIQKWKSLSLFYGVTSYMFTLD